MSSLAPPKAGWWGPFPRDERLWLWLIILTSVLMALITVGWLWVGEQNVPVQSRLTTPEDFEKQVAAFTQKFQVSPGVVRVPPGQDAYMMAKMWNWTPELRLKAGQTYNIWLSSRDVLHGFSITGAGLNVMAAPGHAYRVRLTPQEPGEYLIICNEYCGVGHASMTGKIVVER